MPRTARAERKKERKEQKIKKKEMQALAEDSADLAEVINDFFKQVMPNGETWTTPEATQRLILDLQSGPEYVVNLRNQIEEYCNNCTHEGQSELEVIWAGVLAENTLSKMDEFIAEHYPEHAQTRQGTNIDKYTEMLQNLNKGREKQNIGKEIPKQKKEQNSL